MRIRRKQPNSSYVYRRCRSLTLVDAGISSRLTTRSHPSSAAGADPPIKRTTVRVTNIYATSWRVEPTVSGDDLGDHLRLWRLERNYQIAADQFPCVLTRKSLDPDVIRFKRWNDATAVTGLRIWLFALPSSRVIAAVSIDVARQLPEVVDLLEDCYFCDIHV